MFTDKIGKFFRGGHIKFFLLVALACALFIAAAADQASALEPFGPEAVPAEPDYDKKDSWLSLPENPGQYAVDVFWVYPTILHDKASWLMDIKRLDLLEAAESTLVKQASVFTGQANLYAPLYRQMNMAALALPESEMEAIIAYGKKDVWRAFKYYLKHYNKGRPFILAGHSQGSNILVEMTKGKWGGIGVEKQLVAAYLIGWSITEKDLEQNRSLKICRSAGQTGCFISYNTIAAGKQSAAPTLIKGAVVVNPLTWDTEASRAPAEMNLGAAFFENGESRTIPGFTSAKIEDYGLVVEPKNPALVDSGSETFPKGVYHVFDYSLFYENLKANVAQRIQTYLTKGQ